MVSDSSEPNVLACPWGGRFLAQPRLSIVPRLEFGNQPVVAQDGFPQQGDRARRIADLIGPLDIADRALGIAVGELAHPERQPLDRLSQRVVHHRHRDERDHETAQHRGDGDVHRHLIRHRGNLGRQARHIRRLHVKQGIGAVAQGFGREDGQQSDRDSQSEIQNLARNQAAAKGKTCA